MKSLWHTMTRHPGSMITYFTYIIFWYSTFSAQLKFHSAINSIDEGENIAWGEGVMYGYFLVYVMAILLILVTIANLIFRKGQTFFYWWLLAFIIVPLIILWNI